MRKYNNVICAVAKDENSYINEWIDYHLLLGFDHIFIYDDHSKVPLNTTVGTNAKVSVIQWEPIINYHVATFKQSCQGAVYHDFVTNHSKDCNWFAIIDIDEFILLKKHKNIQSFISDYSESAIGAIALNWVLYGSNGQTLKRNIPILERFTSRGIGTSEWIKCISKSDAVLAYDHCHFPILKPNYIQITPDKKQFPCKGTSILPHYEMNIEGSDEIACINHYCIKSLQELSEKKIRGRADQSEPIDVTEYRYRWDKSDYFDNNIQEYIKSCNNIKDSELLCKVKTRWQDYLNDYRPEDGYTLNTNVAPEWGNYNIYAVLDMLLNDSSYINTTTFNDMQVYHGLNDVVMLNVALLDESYTAYINDNKPKYIVFTNIYQDSYFKLLETFKIEHSHIYKTEFEIKRYYDHDKPDNWGFGISVLKIV